MKDRLALNRVMARLNLSYVEVGKIASRLDPESVLAVITYLEKRLEVMVGDENAKAELETIRRDLGTMATSTLLS